MGFQMNVAICDDEVLYRKVAIDLLNKYSNQTRINFIFYEFDSGADLLKSNISFDIIIMDYQIGQLNGIDTIKILRDNGNESCVIFVSSYKDVVFESMTVKAFRFLVKPIEYSKLCEAIDAYISEKNLGTSIIAQDMDNMSICTLSESDIMYAQAENFYTNIFTQNNSFIYKKTLSHLEGELSNNCFYRCHRSFIVNMDYISSFSKSEITITSNEKIIISKKKYKDFQTTYYNYLKHKGLKLLQ